MQRIGLFQRQNGLEEDGVATPDVQYLLYSDDAVINTEPLPAAPSHYQQADAQSGSDAEMDWFKETCSCCGGKGCVCCDHTGWIWVPASP